MSGSLHRDISWRGNQEVLSVFMLDFTAIPRGHLMLPAQVPHRHRHLFLPSLAILCCKYEPAEGSWGGRGGRGAYDANVALKKA